MGVGSRSVALAAAVCLTAACALEDSSLARLPSRDGGRDGAAPPEAGTDGGPSDGGPRDAGPPPDPVGPLVLAGTGTYAMHPAVAWTGHDFAVLFVMGTDAGGQILLARMRPGQAPHETVVIAPNVLPRRSLTLAARDGALAMGWVEHDGAEWVLEARLEGAGPVGRFSPVKTDSDYDDAHLAWDGSTLHAAVRRDVAGAGHLGAVRFEDLPTFAGDFATPPDSLGELAAFRTGRGTAIATGLGASLYLLEGGAFRAAGRLTGFTGALEGDLAELPDGRLRGVWSDGVGGSTRALTFVRMNPTEDGWAQDGAPAPILDWTGPDPAVAAAGDHLILAWPDTTDGARDLGLALLDREGAVVAGRCSPPAVHALVNDPDVACGGRACAVVWLEAESYDSPSFVTRILQVPVDPARFCP